VLEQARQDMARLGIRRNWQLTAIEQLGLIPAATPAPRATGAGRRISTKPSRNRQDSDAS